MSETLTTQALVSKAQAGAGPAIEELCRRYQDRVLAAVRLRLGKGLRRKLESCDIVQDAMLDAIKGIDAFSFRTEGAFLRYVNKIVENRIRDAAKHWDAQRRAVQQEVALAAHSDAPDPAEDPRVGRHGVTPSKIASLREQYAQLERAMDLLEEESSEQRELIIAVKLEERSYRELSEELGISVDAVRMRVNRAMDLLESLFRRLENE